MPASVLVVNSRAGTARRRRRLEQAVAALGPDVDVVETESSETGTVAAQRAARAGAERVVVAGGDGTVQSVVRGLVSCGASADERPALAFVPTGRGNDLASSYGIEIDPARALRTALEAPASAVLDIGLVTLDGARQVFINALGIGYDAAVASLARGIAIGGMTAYAVGILRTWLLKPWPWSMTARVDGVSVNQPVTLFTIGNGGTTGGGFELTPGAEPWDGRLDYCFSGDLGRGAVLSVLPRVMRGTLGQDPQFTLGQFTRFTACFEPPAPVHGDGEILSPAAREVAVSLEPAGLHVVGGGRAAS